MLMDLGANKSGFLLGSVPELRAFHRACLFLGLWWVGPHAYFQTHQLPLSLCVRRVCAKAVSFLKLGATSTCLLRAGLVRV